MCGFIITNKNVDSFDEANAKIKLRGPDLTNTEKINGITFVHNLLHLTGEVTKQPINEGNVVCLFNGEIYNYKEILPSAKSDAYSILEAYKAANSRWETTFDGEFAICLFDFNTGLGYVVTDTFGIKPAYYSFEEEYFGIASYSSALQSLGFTNIKRVEPNTIIEFSIEPPTILNREAVYKFNLNQINNNYDDWTEAFLNANRKRVLGLDFTNVLPMSSGLDSGGIACALNVIGAKYNTFSIKGSEDKKILEERMSINSAVESFFVQKPSQDTLNKISKFIKANAETFYFGKDYDHKHKNGIKDPGTKGFAYIIHQMKEKFDDFKVVISGLGGDEIMTRNQGYKFGKPNPKIFPDDLSSVFPWDNFYYGAASSYLGMNECICGAYGVEGRYPFFDRKLVQEFLSLKPELKNADEKAPLINFFKEYNYSYTMTKRGFNI
jgi:asparagine synthetase B (glutamine-hydrolysing)